MRILFAANDTLTGLGSRLKHACEPDFTGSSYVRKFGNLSHQEFTTCDQKRDLCTVQQCLEEMTNIYETELSWEAQSRR